MTRPRCSEHPSHYLTSDGWCLATSPMHRPTATLDRYPYPKVQSMESQNQIDQEPSNLADGLLITFSDPGGGESTSLTGRQLSQAVEQMTLSDELFPPLRRRDVPTVRVGISGSVELAREDFEALVLDAAGEPAQVDAGAVVLISCAAYVVSPAPSWVKRSEGRGEERQTWWEKQGVIKLKLTDLARIELTGETWSDCE